MEKIKKLKPIGLILSCAACIILLFILKGFVSFSMESLARISGKMQTITLTADDFELVGIEKRSEQQYITTDGDPQLLFSVPTKMSKISFECEYSVHPGEILMYYSTKEGQGFSANKRYWFYPSSKKENVYQTSFAMKNINAIRLDPTTVAGNNMKITKITINEKNSFLSFFAVDYGKIFNLLIYSCISASIIALALEIINAYDTKKSKL